MENRFTGLLKGKVIIIGIGNILRGDDGFGPLLIEKLVGKVDAHCIDAGTAPESYIGKIIKERPDTVLILDAVHLDRPAGEYDILRKSDIIKTGFTTHDISPGLFIEHLENETRADIYMLGIQPARLSLGEEMSEEVKTALDNITEQITEVIHA